MHYIIIEILKLGSKYYIFVGILIKLFRSVKNLLYLMMMYLDCILKVNIDNASKSYKKILVIQHADVLNLEIR
jgi:hypothetical protein